MDNNYEMGKQKRGGMFKRRLRGELAMGTPQGSVQSQQNLGKMSQISKQQLGAGEPNDKTAKSTGQGGNGMNRLGSGR